MKSFFFVFLGVYETGSDANIGLLKTRLETFLSGDIQPTRSELKEDLLILNFSRPDFRFYLSFAKNDNESFRDWKQFAKDSELPWDMKPVDRLRLENIYAKLEYEGWQEYKPFRELAFAILEEMEKFRQVKVFTIPSMGKATLWNRIIKRVFD